MIIRKAVLADFEAAKALEKEVFQLHYSNRTDFFRYREEPLSFEKYSSMLNSDLVFLLAEEDGEVLGQAIGFRRGYKDHPVFNDVEWLEIDDISVREGHRSKGVGAALFEAMKTEAKAMGLNHIELTVWGFNANAHRFYEKMGMRSRIDRMELNI